MKVRDLRIRDGEKLFRVEEWKGSEFVRFFYPHRLVIYGDRDVKRIESIDGAVTVWF